MLSGTNPKRASRLKPLLRRSDNASPTTKPQRVAGHRSPRSLHAHPNDICTQRTSMTTLGFAYAHHQQRSSNASTTTEARAPGRPLFVGARSRAMHFATLRQNASRLKPLLRRCDNASPTTKQQRIDHHRSPHLHSRSCRSRRSAFTRDALRHAATKRIAARAAPMAMRQRVANNKAATRGQPSKPTHHPRAPLVGRAFRLDVFRHGACKASAVI